MGAAKQGLRYMKCIIVLELIYVKITIGRGLISYSNSDPANDLEDKKNTTSVIFSWDHVQSVCLHRSKRL